jgi:adenylosuccinate lyase
MELNTLTAISPVDGRYRSTCAALDNYFSEYGLIRYRVQVEIEYFLALGNMRLPQLPATSQPDAEKLRDICRLFSISDALEVKEIEKTTNHDVKAVEYFIKNRMDSATLIKHREFVHFGLTSQDINNTAIPLALREASDKVLFPAINELIAKISSLGSAWKNISLLARTHGQPASPTRLGKEIFVFAERLEAQLNQLRQVPFSAKFGGATGNFNAHHLAYPDHDWIGFADKFVNEVLGLHRSRFTTQVEHYDNMAAYCDALKRVNTILVDLCRDMWSYISLDYFKQQLREGEVGSSAMPHKVNPIDFENAEGNLGIANALLEHLASKLPVSRLQRDLTDSTVLRNLGMPLAHSLISYSSILKGLNKLILNETAIHHDLENNWAIVAEAIQTILRREGFPKPYEALKDLTRTNARITRESLHSFINKLDVDARIKEELLKITPHTYTGVNPVF